MKTVFLACTHPFQPTGYARVGCALANGLSNLGWNVVVYGYQNLTSVDRALDPAVRVLDVAKLTNDPVGFGEKAFADLVSAFSPDVIVLYNDVFVVNSFLDCFHTTKSKIIAYLDVVHDHQDLRLIQSIRDRVDHIWVFSEHWKSLFKNVTVIPHGLDECFKKLDRTAARHHLGLPVDGYIVLNSNRNSYRKALDVSIRIFLDAFVELGCPNDLYLFLNCNASCETGYDIQHIIRVECERLKLDYKLISSRHILGMQNSGFLSDETLNVLYNACDVGLNTSVGEGFGLMALELGSLQKPLIVNATGGSRDIMGSEGVEPVETLELCRGFIAHGGRMDIPDSREMRRRLVDFYKSKCTTKPPPFDVAMYSWDTICQKASKSLFSV